jgi:hypothetical protein
MPYELSLAPDPDRGGHRYVAGLSGQLEPATVRELSEWLADAKQNPDASFVIDLTRSTRSARRARLEMRALLRRHDDLRAAGRLSVLGASGRDSRRRVLAGLAAPIAAGALVESVVASGAVPFAV